MLVVTRYPFKPPRDTVIIRVPPSEHDRVIEIKLVQITNRVMARVGIECDRDCDVHRLETLDQSVGDAGQLKGDGRADAQKVQRTAPPG